jgi:hypothetical protein
VWVGALVKVSHALIIIDSRPDFKAHANEFAIDIRCDHQLVAIS